MPAARAAEPQELDGLVVAAAIEKTMVAAIAAAEKSVVAIARGTPRDSNLAAVAPEAPMFFGGQFPQAQASDATSPDFVPHEFATGVIIDERGLILTCFHAINAQKEVPHYITTADRRTFVAHVVGGDARYDLAVLRIDAKPSDVKFTPIKFGDAKTLKKGQIVLALGNPYAIARDGQVSACWGIVSNLSRKVVGSAADRGNFSQPLHQLGTLIQTDAKLNFGTSGGPLLNLRGEMIGLNTALAAAPAYEQAAGFSIPVDDAFKGYVEKLKIGREVAYGLLGVVPENPSYELRLHGVRGVFLKEVSGGKPAHRAGLAPGDLVTEIDGEPIHDADTLRLAIARHPPSSTVAIAAQRQRLQFVVHAKLAKAGNTAAQVITTPEPAWRGLRVDYPPVPLFRGGFWDEPSDEGVQVTDVEAGSAAAKAGVVRGMLITKVNGQPTTDPDEFHRRVAAAKGAVELSVTVDRARQTLTVPAN